MRIHRSFAIAILMLACAITVGACSNPAQVEIDRGDELMNAGKREQAFKAYAAALELDPDNADAFAGRGCSRPLVENAIALADVEKAIGRPRADGGVRPRVNRGSRPAVTVPTGVRPAAP